MKKKLTSNSFDALKMEQQPSGEIANRAMSGGGYFNEYGILYQAADGNTYWTRTREDSGNSHGATFGDYWDSLNSDYQAAGSDMYDPNVLNYGTSNNPVSQADYNTLARKGRWFGGYVEGLGRVEEYASSIDYGNSIYNGSWVRYGSEGYPVSKTDYYQLSEDGDWHGGYVEGHGYLGEHDYIPGMSTSQVYTGVNRVKTNGVNIVVNRMRYGDKSTLSQFKMFAYGAYGEILSTLEGYFLEPEADYERSNKAGSDTAILPGVYEVQPSTYDGRLTDLRNAPKQIETIIQNTHSKSLESVVTFRQGKTTISTDQIPNVERIATYMKNNPKSTVSIKGYASPEGSAEVNARVAKQRAEAVKNMLISKYKISASRITAEGQGVGSMFSEPDWNRVSIATLSESE